MSTIVHKETMIPSCSDFELDIKRTQKLRYQYTYPTSKKLNGIVFLIAGFGADTNSEYSKKLRAHIAKKFSVVAVSVEYHCFNSRPANGAQLVFDTSDINLIKENLNKNYIHYSDNESPHELLTKWENTFKEYKEQGKVDKDLKSIITMTINPKNEEYQNFGIMQALDHINVLNDLENMPFNFIKNSSVTLMGSSHGGYIANLTAKLAPSKIDCVIDNSSYVKPPLNYIVGKDTDMLKPEFMIAQEHLQINCFVKTPWTNNNVMPNYFSEDRYRIRDISDKKHLEYMSSLSKRTKYISYHSSKDGIAPINDKIELYDTLNKLGFDAELHVVKDDIQVDGKFIKTLAHGMEMSLKELANRELPNALKCNSNEKNYSNDISYKCDQVEYRFENYGNLYNGKNIPFVRVQEPDSLIEEQVTKTYLDNIAYLKLNQTALYEKIIALESALDKGYHDAKYELEYKEEGYFDVKERLDGNYLYGNNSQKYAKKSAENINDNKIDDLFETFYHLNFTDEHIKHYKETMDISSNGGYGVAPIIQYTNSATTKDMHLKSIEKFIFFGVGLGTHIASIDEKIKAFTYLIVEDDLELFRLSLFTVNYKELSKNSSLFFAIFEEDDSAKSIFRGFLEKNFFHNQYIKFFQMLNVDDKKVKVMHSVIASLDYMVYPYHAYFSQYLRPLEYMKEHHRFLNISGEKELKVLTEKPVLLVAAGPSLKKNIKWLKENQDRFVVVALTATLTTLEKEGITPDVITHVDPFEEGSIPHIENLTSMEFLKDTFCIFGAKSPLALTEKFDKNRVFIFEGNSYYIKEFGSLSLGACVGSTTYALLLALGAREVHLLGLDLALDEKTGATHSDAHAYNSKKDLSKADELEDVFAYKDSVVKVKGNFKDEVFTTALFYSSIVSINNGTLVFKKEKQKVYNFNDGAYFQNTISVKIKDFIVGDLKILDKADMRQELFENLEQNSIDSFSSDDIIEPIKKRSSHVKSVKNILKRYQSQSTYTSVEAYRRDLGNLVRDVLEAKERESVELLMIYYKYFQYILPYIYDMLNTKELKNPKRHIKKIDKLLLVKLLEIAEYYDDVIEAFLEEELVY